MKRFRGIIDNPDTRHKELAVAIKGYGYFAKVSVLDSILYSHFELC